MVGDIIAVKRNKHVDGFCYTQSNEFVFDLKFLLHRARAVKPNCHKPRNTDIDGYCHDDDSNVAAFDDFRLVAQHQTDQDGENDE